MKFIITLLLISFSTLLVGQDTLNQLNSKGKKTGYWKVLLNDKVDPVDSLKDAYFYGIELWDNGVDVFKFHKHGSWASEKMVFSGKFPQKGNPVLIDGTFKWFDDKALITSEEIYKNGKPFFIKSYSWDKEDPKISFFNEVLYFDRLLDNIPGTYYYEEYGYGGELKQKYWFRKGRRGWRVYKIKD